MSRSLLRQLLRCYQVKLACRCSSLATLQRNNSHLRSSTPAKFASTAAFVPERNLNSCTPEESAPVEMNVDDFSQLATSEEIRNRIHLILLEYVNCRDTIGRVPSQLSQNDMEELLAIKSSAGRAKYFNYLFKSEMAGKADRRRREQKRLARLAEKEEKRQKAIEDGSINHIQYGIENTIFLFIRPPSVAMFYNYRQMYAALFGQTVVYDCDYEHIMQKREIINAADQLQEVYSANRAHSDPFNLVFCNLRAESEYKARVLRALHHLEEPTCLITSTEKSYLDIYPKERIVYLTPDAKKTLTYNPDDIYVVGAIVDKTIQKPVSLAKAKREGLRMAKLPLDDYLPWGTSASKSLPLNIIMKILLELKVSRDWNKALKCIPTRKLKTNRELEEQALMEEVKKKKLMRRSVNMKSIMNET
ncbi:mitochondrial ribonuclease P protein 1 homolog [Ornithodoros turicata]|uniref:mitochondrial ribonuclease P protein 1 homolog n=1 Tax=Ornithodoros turicata TaxID=34597 RepID=UPI0031393483